MTDSLKKPKRKPINNTVNKRSLARLMAVQALYQYEFHGKNRELKELTSELLENYLLDVNNEKTLPYHSKTDLKLLENLTSGVILALPQIDEQIQEFLAENREINQLPEIILPVLRLGVFELKYMKNTPWKVVVSEYVDIAGSFYEADKIAIVNGILQKIAFKYHDQK